MAAEARADEWIGVAEVAAEMNLSDRGAWELVRRLGVRRLEPGRAIMKDARFRRGDWELARDAAIGPPVPRAAKVPAAAEKAGTKSRGGVTEADVRARFRGA